MPLFIASNSIAKIADESIPGISNTLNDGFQKVREHSTFKKTNNRLSSQIDTNSLDLKRDLNNLLVSQQEIQNKLSFSESQARTAKEAVSIIEKILKERASNDFDKHGKLIQKLNKILNASFNNQSLLNSKRNHINKNNILDDLEAKLTLFTDIQDAAVLQVTQLRKDNRIFSIKSQNIQAIGGRLNKKEDITVSIQIAKEKLLTISTDSLRIQANTNLHSTIMHLS